MFHIHFMLKRILYRSLYFTGFRKDGLFSVYDFRYRLLRCLRITDLIPTLRGISNDMEIRIVPDTKSGIKNNSVNGGFPWLQQQMTAPRPIVICGPSGSGKSTLLKKLMEEFGDYFGFSISHTTRKPRPGEKSGKDYFFVDRTEMERGISNGDFLEFAIFSGNMYGTSKKSVKRVQEQGRICILDIEIDGVRSIKKTDLNPRYIFIKPPSIEILEERLRGRGTESEESIQKRLFRAKEELRFGETPGNFDLLLVNEDVGETYKQLRKFLLNDIEALKNKSDETGDHE